MRDRIESMLRDGRSALIVGGSLVAVGVVVVVVVMIVLITTLRGDGPDDVTAPPPPPTTGAHDDEPPPVEGDGPLDSARAIQAAVERARPGDDLVIASGTYRLSLDINGVSGTAADPIRLRAEPGGRVTIISSGEPYALYVHNAAHWEIGSDDAALTFDGDRRAHATVGLGLYSGSVAETSNVDPGPTEGITLRNLDVVRSGQALVRIAHGSTDIELVDSRLSRSGRRRAEFGEGIYIGSAKGQDAVSDIRVRNVEISDVRAEAIDVKAGSGDISVEGVVISDVELRSDDTNNKCAIAQRGDGLLTIVDTTVSGVRSGDDVDVARNEPCGIYVDGPISVERTTITDTGREAVWVNNTDRDITVRIVASEFSHNGGSPTGISHSGERVEWTVRGIDPAILSASVAGPNVELGPGAAPVVSATAPEGS